MCAYISGLAAVARQPDMQVYMAVYTQIHTDKLARCGSRQRVFAKTCLRAGLLPRKSWASHGAAWHAMTVQALHLPYYPGGPAVAHNCSDTADP